MIEALDQRLAWLPALVTDTRTETPSVRTIGVSVPRWAGHLAGQHVDIRLTAEDGYQAQRSYSLSSPPHGDGALEITVERVPDGEVSPFLIDELRVGDTIELRGPIGGYFAWQPGDGGPLLLVGGGSGIAPLMAILRARVASGDATSVTLLYSVRREDDLIFRTELDRLAAASDGVRVIYTLTRGAPPGWIGETRRIDGAMLERYAPPATARPLAFVCGPTPFVEVVADHLVALGLEASRIKTERFGPTGEAE